MPTLSQEEVPGRSYLIIQAIPRFSGSLKPEATWATRRPKVQLVQTSHLQGKKKQVPERRDDLPSTAVRAEPQPRAPAPRASVTSFAAARKTSSAP